MEQKVIMELITTLEKYGLQKEKKEVELLVDYLDNMDEEFQTIIDEVKNLNKEMSSFKSQSDMKYIQNKIMAAKDIVAVIKNNFVQGVTNIIKISKDSSISVMQKSIAAMKIPSALEHIRGGLRKAIEAINQGAQQLGVMQGEVQAIGLHVKNVTLAVRGKELSSADPEKRSLSKTQNILIHIEKIFSKMEIYTDNCIEKVNQLEHRKTSVRNQIKRSGNKKLPEPRLTDKER